jgi:DNA-binding response OmpR family regulator
VLVLVADDDDDIRELLVEAFGRVPGVRAIGARDGEEAMAMAIANAPDVVVLDQRMPRMTGMEVLAALRARSFAAVVVLVTAADAASLAAQHGVELWLRKPFGLDELDALIRRAIAARR